MGLRGDGDLDVPVFNNLTPVFAVVTAYFLLGEPSVFCRDLERFSSSAAFIQSVTATASCARTPSFLDRIVYDP